MPEFKPHITPEMLKAYADGGLTPAERYAVERAALRDETVREVLEGYEQIKEQQIDLSAVNNRLKNRLQKRIEKPKKKTVILWWKYGLAASVLLGVFISSYLLFNKLEKENLALEASPVEIKKQQSSPSSSPKISEKQEITEQASEPASLAKDALQKPVIKKVEPVKEQQETAALKPEIVEQQIAKVIDEKIAEPDLEKAESVVAMEEVVVNAAPATRSKKQVASKESNSLSVKITDENGEPLPGVMIEVKGKTIGTVSDTEGAFELNNISPSDYIQLSYIGYKPREVAAKDVNESIVLIEDSQTLQEVIVMGYGDAMPNQTATPIIGWENFRKELIVKSATEGKVVLLLTISQNGEVINKELKKGLGEPYDSQALNLSIFNKLWNPTYKDGKAVEEKVRVVVRFKSK